MSDSGPSLDKQDFEKAEAFYRGRDVSVLAILFTDIVGYTRLCEQYPEETMDDVRDAFFEKTQEIFESVHGGRVLKFIGDAALAVFALPSDALLAAVDLHRFLETNMFEEVSLELRTGIHLGQVKVKLLGSSMDIFGKQVNRTSRLLGVAKPKQIVVSESVEDNARGWVEKESERKIGFSHKQTFMLRGSPRPMSVYFVKYGNGGGVTKSPFPDAEEPAWLRIQIEPPGQIRLFESVEARQFMIGRNLECDICLSDNRVSRNHAIIQLGNAGNWQIRDLGSANGTLLNRQPLKESADLKIGDVLQVAHWELKVLDLSLGSDIFKTVRLPVDS